MENTKPKYDKSENEIFKKLKIDKENLSQRKINNKNHGINLRLTDSLLDRAVYLYFCEFANKKNLSKSTLEWMNNFINTEAGEDLKKNLIDKEWLKQMRKLKG